MNTQQAELVRRAEIAARALAQRFGLGNVRFLGLHRHPPAAMTAALEAIAVFLEKVEQSAGAPEPAAEQAPEPAMTLFEQAGRLSPEERLKQLSEFPHIGEATARKIGEVFEE